MTEVQELPRPSSPSPQPTPEPEKMDDTAEQRDAEELPPAVDDVEAPKMDESPIPVESEPVEPPVVAEPEQDPAEKKRVQDQLRQESRKRGNRMFGMMLGTLKRAKEQVDTSVESDSMKKRLELEKKLKDKLDGERKILQLRSEREREVRDLKANIQKREEEIGSADAIYRVRHDAKYNLAGFLCTSFPLPSPASTTDAISVPFSPRLPHSMHLTTPTSSSNRPIYYLPYRLLPSQEDRIEDQIDVVKKATRRDQDEWKDLKAGKQKEVRKLREELDDKVQEVGRLEREDRQRKRREAEDREESEKKEREKRRKVSRETRRDRSPSKEKEVTMDRDETPTSNDVTETPSEEVGAEKNGSVEQADKMESEEKKEEVNGKEDERKLGDEEEQSESTKMDIAGDDDLEY
ncbi:hypothetical protein JCM5353_002071 [Sporobolomyces roseus]